MIMDLKLGLKEPVYNKSDLLLSNYFDFSRLPIPPPTYGYEHLIPGNWNMFGNNIYGDCVPAGIGHQEMLFNAEGGHPYDVFNVNSVLRNYSLMTGFDPDDPSTDTGTDMRQAYNYWRKRGFVDNVGVAHQIEGWAALEPGNIQEARTALYLFGTIGIGYDWPESAFDQFEAGKPFIPVAGAKSAGMHYICQTGYAGYGRGVCWGRLVLWSESFYRKQCRMAAVPFSKEMLVSGKSLSGFGANELLSDLSKI